MAVVDNSDNSELTVMAMIRHKQKSDNQHNFKSDSDKLTKWFYAIFKVDCVYDNNQTIWWSG